MTGLKPRLLSTNEYQSILLGPAGNVVVQMERTGVVIDTKILGDIVIEMSLLAGELRDELMDWSPREVNWKSWKQLSEWLHNNPDDDIPGLGLKPSPYCKKGEVADDKIATDDRALEWLAGHHPAHRTYLNTIRKLRQVERMQRYAIEWQKQVIHHGDGTTRLHPTFGLASDYDTRAGARTGRFGVKNPALNQVPSNPAHDPAKIKRAFIAPPGYRLICADYSQLEVVINGHIISQKFGSDDPLVKKLLSREDIHGPAARYIFGDLAGDTEVSNASTGDFKDKSKPKLIELRGLGKIGIYGKNYGKGINGFAWSTFLTYGPSAGEPLGLEKATLLFNGLDKFYPGIPKYQNFVREWIAKYRYIVTLFGRWYPLPDAISKIFSARQRAWRQALNYPMQGGGQEIMMLALILISEDKLLKELGFVLSLVVHDEILGFAPEKNADRALARVNELMITCVELLCPLRVEGHHAPNWSEAKG
jgi:DNA polymerase I